MGGDYDGLQGGDGIDSEEAELEAAREASRVVGVGAAGAEPFPVAHALCEAQMWLRRASFNELRAAVNGSRLVEATKRSLEGQLWDLVSQ